MASEPAFDVEAFVFVLDMDRALEFYRSRLGFAVEISDGTPPHFAQVVRSGARLNLRRVDKPVIDPLRRDDEELLSAAITVADINALYAEFSAADVPLFRHLHTAPWGARTFIVSDPDGNLILFAG